MAKSSTAKRPSTQTKSKKPTGARRKSTTKKASTSRSKNDQVEQPLSNDLRYELVVLLFGALSLLLIISVYFSIGGKVGETLRNLLFGFFGISAYLLPIYILGASFVKVFNRGNARINNKLSLIFIAILVVSTFTHVTYIEKAQLLQQINDEYTFFVTTGIYYKIAALSHVGGGMVGGVLGDIFVYILGRIGSFIILSLIALSLVILISERSIAIVGHGLMALGLWLWRGIKNTFVALVQWIKEKKAMGEQKAERRAEEAMGYTQEEQLASEPVVKKKRKGFFQKATLTDEDGKSNDEKPAVIKPKEEKATEKQEKTKAYKVHGLDPFQKIIEQEEKERAFADQYKEKPKKLQPTDSFAKVEEVDIRPSATKEKPVPVEVIQTEIQTEVKPVVYRLPPMELMKSPKGGKSHVSMTAIDEKAAKLIQTLESFGVGAKILDVSVGPTVTRYELQPDIGVKVSKIVNLQDDIALNLASSGIRIEAPIPGKSAVGIEVPNAETQSVLLKEVLDTPDFAKFPSKICFALGKDIGGKTIIADIGRMPHLLIAGATGSGKSVCVNTLITSILYKATPDEVKLLMIDPKVVELSAYNGIPHLLIPVVTDPKKAAGALNWAVQEMNDRYKLFAAANVRDLKGYNNAVVENNEGKPLPQIVIIVDELADLMMAAPNDVEDAICRLAQMARAAGLHLIIATQRPSVDVITGLIKANIPSRIAFNVSSGVDSRTIIDSVGAEKLLGKGDMLFYPVGMQKPIRVQGAFISDKEVENLVTFLKDQAKVIYNERIINQITKTTEAGNATSGGGDFDSYFNEALELVIDKQKASASMIQRRFRVGYNRAARIVDQLHDEGFVGDEEGSKPRKVLMTRESYEAMKAEKATSEDGDENA